jgi:hypothetical protein
MTEPSTPNPPKKTRGGQKGNTNALKHGLYASHYTPAERHNLELMPPMESIHEVHLLRLTLEKILSMIESCDDPDRLIKLYNTLYLGSQRLMTAMRTNNILVGDNQEVLTSFWEAVELYRKEHDLK